MRFTSRHFVIAAVVVLGVVALLAVLQSGDDAVDVETSPVDLDFTVSFFNVVDGTVWVSVDGDGYDQHMELDPSTGQELGRIAAGIGSGPYVGAGHLWVSRGTPGEDDLPIIGPNQFGESVSDWQLVRIDPDTYQPDGVINTTYDLDSQQLVFDDRLWVADHTTDLVTGEQDPIGIEVHNHQVAVFDGVVWFADHDGIHRAERSRDDPPVVAHHVQFKSPFDFSGLLPDDRDELVALEIYPSDYATIKDWDGRYCRGPAKVNPSMRSLSILILGDLVSRSRRIGSRPGRSVWVTGFVWISTPMTTGTWMLRREGIPTVGSSSSLRPVTRL